MATDATEVESDPEETQEETQEEQPKKKFAPSKKVKILLLLVLVMAVEAGGFLLLVPGSSSGTATGDDAGEEADIETVEVSIGNFKTNNGSAAPGRRYSIQFELTAIVAKNQEAIFRIAVTKEHKSRVKGAVERIVGSATLEELDDAHFIVISKNIREAINKELRRSYVNQVIITNYEMFPIE